MAVRLRNVTGPDDEPAEITTGWDHALKPSSRIMGGSLTDKLGSRMGLRLPDEHVLADVPEVPDIPEQQSAAHTDVPSASSAR